MSSAAALVALITGLVTAFASVDNVTVSSETLGSWSGSALAQGTTSAQGTPVDQPLYTCAGALDVKVVFQHLQASAYAQCDIVVNTFAFSWTWTDANTGAVLYSGGGSEADSTSLSASYSADVGTPGQRNVEICFTTYVTGFAAYGDCLPQKGV